MAIDDLRLIFGDFEVTKGDWLLCLKDRKTKKKVSIWNDWAKLQTLWNQDEFIFVGANVKGYDQYILKAILLDADQATIKDINDWIISGKGRGYEHPFFEGRFCRVWQCDIYDDSQEGTSVKMIEGHLGLPIVESTVPFDIDRKLTADEQAEMEFYCWKDVETVEVTFEARCDIASYFTTKLIVAEMGNIDPRRAIGMSNAKLAAEYLGAVKREGIESDEREATYPDTVDRTFVPKEVFEYFERLRDDKLTYEQLFGKGSEKLSLPIGKDFTVVYGFGGIHGAKNDVYELNLAGDSDRVIRNLDAESMYPNLILNHNYYSRAITQPEKFEQSVKLRSLYKHSDNPKERDQASGLKLINNIKYGAMKEKFNKLYDPRMVRSTCMSGQLWLTQLTMKLLAYVPSMDVIQVNTDGIMISYKRSEDPIVKDIVAEFEEDSGLKMGEDKIQRILQKDVNNYLMVEESGKLKMKGGYFPLSLKPKSEWTVMDSIPGGGSFTINNTWAYVKDSLAYYLLFDVTPEKFIESETNILRFQQIGKAGRTYKGCFHEKNGEFVRVQKVNRIYATKDESYGMVYKAKPVDPYELLEKLIRAEKSKRARRKDKETIRPPEQELLDQRDRAIEEVAFFIVQKSKSKLYWDQTEQRMYSLEKIENCPEHAVIDNTCELEIKDIDLDFYVKQAWEAIDKFTVKGKKE